MTAEPAPDVPWATCKMCHPPGVVEGNIFDHLNLLHPGWDEGGEPAKDVPDPFEHPVITEAALEPYGILCADCRRPFRVGDRYAERLDGFIGDTPLVEILCLGCAGAQSA